MPDDFIRLRNIEAGDLPWMYAMHIDPESNRMAMVIPRTAEAFDARWTIAMRDPSVTTKSILLDDVPVGSISYFQHDDRANVGYCIERAHWGRGIATRALRLLLTEVTTRPLYARVATSNVASLRVLQKCGFVVEHVWMSPATDRYLECEEASLVLK